MKLKEIKPNMVVHCNTEEEAKELIKWAYECGFKWKFSSKEVTHWDDNRYNIGLTYYTNNRNITYTYAADHVAKEFSDLIISDGEELTAVEAITLKEEMCENCVTSYECIFKKNYSGKVSIDCNEWMKYHPKEVIESLKQYKKNHSSIKLKEPEIEWVYECYNLDEKIGVKNKAATFYNEQDAIDWCEKIVKKHSIDVTYKEVCRVKEK